MDPNKSFKNHKQPIDKDRYKVFCVRCGYTTTILKKLWNGMSDSQIDKVLCGSCEAVGLIRLDLT